MIAEQLMCELACSRSTQCFFCLVTFSGDSQILLVGVVGRLGLCLRVLGDDVVGLAGQRHRLPLFDGVVASLNLASHIGHLLTGYQIDDRLARLLQINSLVWQLHLNEGLLPFGHTQRRLFSDERKLMIHLRKLHHRLILTCTCGGLRFVATWPRGNPRGKRITFDTTETLKQIPHPELCLVSWLFAHHCRNADRCRLMHRELMHHSLPRSAELRSPDVRIFEGVDGAGLGRRSENLGCHLHLHLLVTAATNLSSILLGMDELERVVLGLVRFLHVPHPLTVLWNKPLRRSGILRTLPQLLVGGEVSELLLKVSEDGADIIEQRRYVVVDVEAIGLRLLLHRRVHNLPPFPTSREVWRRWRIRRHERVVLAVT